jgi:hypothetical protein
MSFPIEIKWYWLKIIMHKFKFRKLTISKDFHNILHARNFHIFNITVALVLQWILTNLD